MEFPDKSMDLTDIKNEEPFDLCEVSGVYESVQSVNGLEAKADLPLKEEVKSVTETLYSAKSPQERRGTSSMIGFSESFHTKCDEVPAMKELVPVLDAHLLPSGDSPGVRGIKSENDSFSGVSDVTVKNDNLSSVVMAAYVSALGSFKEDKDVRSVFNETPCENQFIKTCPEEDESYIIKEEEEFIEEDPKCMLYNVQDSCDEADPLLCDPDAECIKESRQAGSADVRVSCKPFNFAFLPNFFTDPSLLENVCRELGELDSVVKNNDLYKYLCTEDLQSQNSPGLRALCDIFRGPLRTWMESVSGIRLNKKVYLGCSKYDYSDMLLCHDDELEGRQIAFILYLVPPWRKSYGGSLDLFSADEHGRPLRISQRLYPEFNAFAFFEVSPVSFHQVSEVVVRDKMRLSINGWFHGDPKDWPARHIGRVPRFMLPSSVEEHVVYKWINPAYLDQATQAEIRRDFRSRSEVSLTDFLNRSKYSRLAEALRGDHMLWLWTGPPYKRHYEVAKRESVPLVVREFFQLMQSEAVFLILSQLTGLSLHRLGPGEEDSSSESEMAGRSDGEESGSEESSLQEQENNQVPKGKSKRKTPKMMSLSSDDGTEVPMNGLDEEWTSDAEEDVTTQCQQGDHQGETWNQVRRWSWSAYTLMRDDDLQQRHSFILDVLLFCNVSPHWKAEYGGHTVYVARDEEEEILSVLPSSNCLALVYRDKDTLKFTKYINVRSQELEKDESTFHDIYCEFREVARK